MDLRPLLVAALSLALAGCVEQSPDAPPPAVGTWAPGGGPYQSPPVPPNAPFPPIDYSAPNWWVCRGDQPTDACRQDMDATELRVDGSRVRIPFVPAANPDVDCFYVYPTVDLRMTLGLHTDFSDTSSMRVVTRAQAGRLGQVCRVFAPLYRQVTFGTFFSKDVAQRDAALEHAYDDVRNAFDTYMQRFNGGRRVVLVGHSQGGGMVVRLLRERFDPDPNMRSRLVVALPVGADFTVGQLPNVPVCTRDDEQACVVTFKTFVSGYPARSWSPIPPGRVTACVNPADVPGNTRRALIQAVFPTRENYGGPNPGPIFTDAPFLLVDGAYAAQCVEGVDGFRYLQVQATGMTPLPLTNPAWRGALGLHVLDMQLSQGDLVEIVRRRDARR
jgi:hypothetical protein